VKNLSLLLLVLLAGCGTNPQTPNTPNIPDDPNNPYAAFGCSQSPNVGPEPRILSDVEVGKVYALQGGIYRLNFDSAVPSRIRVTLTELDAYDNLSLILGDTIDISRIVTFAHNAGSGSTEDGPPLQTVILESAEKLEVTVGLTVNRQLSDNTLRNNEGKQLFCQTYNVLIERIPWNDL
jgi:hypothetical protein